MANLNALHIKLELWSSLAYIKMSRTFREQFGFHIKEFTFEKILVYLYTPKDSSSLAVTRILFGLAMLFDIPDERGGAIIDKRWGDPTICHFPLVPFLQAVSMPYMALVYAALWLGALGITVGYKYRFSASLFTICYWYLFLIEKSYWNNHSYLFGLVALLLACTEANCYWSLDVYLDASKRKQVVPYWNYFILKYQFFILYFMAGLKKGTAEWLTGYSVQNLSEHWVFNPIKLFLTIPQTDILIVHWFVFVFDLTVAVWMMWSATRHVAMVFCALFHFMNSRLFRIGMFPWVCLATMPLFYPFDWPKIIIGFTENKLLDVKENIFKCINNLKLNSTSSKCLSNKMHNPDTDQEPEEFPDVSGNHEKDCKNNSVDEKIVQNTKSDSIEKEFDQNPGHERKNTTFAFIVFHVVTQAFLPYSHCITKGYNNWTPGLYGYSWDMMIHTWEIDSVVVKIVDNNNQEEFYIDPYIYSPNDRWTRHGDMLYQYAGCLRENLVNQFEKRNWNDGSRRTRIYNGNVSIFVDVWCSLNGRFTQRMFDPKVDILNVSWTAFQPVTYLMPLLDEALDWRPMLHEMKAKVHSWNNYSDVVFVADFPGYDHEKYIPPEMTNVSLTILNGTVAYQPEVSKYFNARSYRITKGNRIELDSGTFHRVINIGDAPALYMYTFANSSEALKEKLPAPKPKLPIDQELLRRLNNMVKFANIVFTYILQVLFQFKYRD